MLHTSQKSSKYYANSTLRINFLKSKSFWLLSPLEYILCKNFQISYLDGSPLKCDVETTKMIIGSCCPNLDGASNWLFIYDQMP